MPGLTRHLALILEEIRHEAGCIVGKDAGCDFCARMEQGGGEEGLAALGIGGAVDQAAKLRPGQGSGTHRAGLYRDV